MRHTQKSKEREYSIPFHNDVLFKYILIGEDAGLATLRSRIIEKIYGLKIQKTQVLNLEPLSEAFFGKRAVLDVVLEDETGYLYDLRTQVSDYTKEERLCSQQYGYRLVRRQLKQGDDYTKLKPFHQIIFTFVMPRDTGCMIRHYTVEDEDNREESNGILHRATMFLPATRQCIKEVGGIENLMEFETLYYVLAYNPDDVILNMKRRMVNVAMEKYDEVREGGSSFSWAESTESAERAVQANLGKQTAEAERFGPEKGFQKGLGQGTEKGIMKGLEKGIEKDTEKGMEKGLEKGKRTLLKSQIVHKYGKEDDWIDTLPDYQVEDAILHILECGTYDALKDRLKGKEVK